MAAVSTAPGLPASRTNSHVETLSTLPDPRSPDLSRSNSNSAHHPSLSNEVATLSNKLIRAINHQTDLDDNLAATRQELHSARERIQRLEAMVGEHNASISRGDLVTKTEVENQKMQLMAHLADEQEQRGAMENDKRGMEQELESLTTALFEEANQMVAAARKEREAADRKNDQLRAQLNDAELLLASHQEQLADLKEVMHQMSLERDDIDINTACSTAPSTPAMQMQESLSRAADTLHLNPTSPGADDILPAPPTSFAHLIHPVLRTDLNAYDDFQTLLQQSRKSSPTSRVSSSTCGSLDASALNKLARKEQPHTNGHVPFNGSTSSLSTAGTHQSSPVTPSSTNSSILSRDMPVAGIPLKETRFYKRALTEDIEPTLRLDTAPGLSWLARRTVINSMSEGGLVVEPMPAAVRSNVFACSLCGENRQGVDHARSHRFRTSDNENAQRYPLCGFCLNRIRASCDFLGFLRMLKDGHWRTGGEEEEMQAWEECVKLRERMFWARIGGGVIPAFLRTRDSPRSSVDQHYLDQPKSKIETKEMSLDLHHATVDESTSHNKSVSQTQTDSDSGSDLNTLLTQPITGPVDGIHTGTGPDRLRNELQSSVQDLPQGLGIENAPVEAHGSHSRISITVPGAFE